MTADPGLGPRSRALRLVLVMGLLAGGSAVTAAEGEDASDVGRAAGPDAAAGPSPPRGVPSAGAPSATRARSDGEATPPTRGGEPAVPDPDQRVPDPDRLEHAPPVPVGSPPLEPPTRGVQPAPPRPEEAGDEVVEKTVLKEGVILEETTRVPDPDRLPQAPAEPAARDAKP